MPDNDNASRGITAQDLLGVTGNLQHAMPEQAKKLGRENSIMIQKTIIERVNEVKLVIFHAADVQICCATWRAEMCLPVCLTVGHCTLGDSHWFVCPCYDLPCW